MAEGQKRCALCGQYYDADYDGCPHCARGVVAPPAAPASKPKSNNGVVGLVAILIPLMLCGLLWTCSSSSAPKDDPALAERVQQTLNSTGGGPAIHHVTAEDNGRVIVTLTVRKEDLGGSVLANDAGKSVANVVFMGVPEVKEVSVFDANSSMIDIYSRN